MHVLQQSQQVASRQATGTRGMKNNARRWNLDAQYPSDACFPALLTWHLELNGTRPAGKPDMRDVEWTYPDFAAAVDDGAAQPESKAKKVGRWCSGENKPDQVAIKRILHVLFGNNRAFEAWKHDLRRAWTDYTAPRQRPAKATSPDAGSARPIGEGDTGSTTGSAGAAQIDRELGLRRDLLEMVAMRFGHDAPDAPDEVLLGFIKEKGREYSQLKSELADIAEPDERLKAAHQLADALVAEGRFEEADALLGQAEEYYKFAKLAISVSTQAETRRKRVLNAVRQGNIREAYDHFQTIARLYGTIHPDMEEIHRVMFAMALLTMDPPPSDVGQDLVIELLEPIIGHYRLCYMYGMGSDIGYGDTKVNRLMLLPFLMFAPKVAAFVTEGL